MKIQIMGGKVCLMCKGKTLLGVVKKLLKTKKIVDNAQQCFAFTPQANFPAHEGEGDGIKFRLPFKIFLTQGEENLQFSCQLSIF